MNTSTVTRFTTGIRHSMLAILGAGARVSFQGVRPVKRKLSPG